MMVGGGGCRRDLAVHRHHGHCDAGRTDNLGLGRLGIRLERLHVSYAGKAPSPVVHSMVVTCACAVLFSASAFTGADRVRCPNFGNSGRSGRQADSGGKVVVADFYATWCPPCRTAAPIFGAMSLEFPNAVFLKCDVDAVRRNRLPKHRVQNDGPRFF